MGTTPNLDLPYPEGTDLVVNGDDAIEALAAAVDYALALDAFMTVMPAESTKAVGGETNVDFPGTAGSSGFTRDGDGFVYNGPATRYFLISASVEVENNGPATSMSSTVLVYHNGTQIMGSHDLVANTSATLAGRRVAHTVTVPQPLAAGDRIDVNALASPAGGLGITAIRIYPIGPKY